MSFFEWNPRLCKQTDRYDGANNPKFIILRNFLNCVYDLYCHFTDLPWNNWQVFLIRKLETVLKSLATIYTQVVQLLERTPSDTIYWDLVNGTTHGISNPVEALSAVFSGIISIHQYPT